MMANQKKCSKCNELKSTTQFSKHIRSKDGLQARCKSCNKEQNYEYLNSNVVPKIYTITNPIGEVYVGSTEIPINIRFHKHRTKYKVKHGEHPLLHASFDLWGIDSHIFKLVYEIQNIDTAELREIESNMIKAFKHNGKSLNVRN
jgi:hypothetical protein